MAGAHCVARHNVVYERARDVLLDDKSRYINLVSYNHWQTVSPFDIQIVVDPMSLQKSRCQSLVVFKTPIVSFYPQDFPAYLGLRGNK